MNPCWPLTAVNANPGDSVNVRIYYHNTNNQNNTNTRVILNAPTSASNSHTFSGQIVSDQGSISFGPVYINLSSSQKLTFGSTRWYPNQTQTHAPLLYGQDGSELLGSGLKIGTITPSWSSQGSVVVSFYVNKSVPTGTLVASSPSCLIQVGNNSCDINFSWNTQNPVTTSAVTRDGGQTVANSNSGSQVFNIPYNGGTFRLYNNAIELDSKSVGASCVSGTSWNGVICANNVSPTYSCMISDFKANGNLLTTVLSGEHVNLSWATENCYNVSISPNVGTGLNLNSNYAVYPTSTTTYRLTAQGSTGASVYRTVTVTVVPKVEETYYCIITDFKADQNYLFYGENTRLRWTTNNCYSVSISNVGTVQNSGNRSVSPSRTTNYTLTALGTNGVRQTRSIDIIVDPANYQLPGGNNCTINSFNSNPNYINQGARATLGWNTSNCSSVNISGIGNVSLGGSRIVYPGGTTNYLLTAYGENGQSITRATSVVVNIPMVTVAPPFVPVYNSCAVTTVATNVSQSQATLNGLITNQSGYTNTYFEYGPTINLGLRTPTRAHSGNTSFSETISGLSANTIYYFRFVADCQGTTGQGSLEVFRTTSSQAIRPIIIQGTTVSGISSPVMLKIENRYEAVGRGDIIDYTVTYKNIRKSNLLNPILQVIAPKGIAFINSSKGTYAEDTRTLTAELENLSPGEEGIIYVQGIVNSMVDNTAQIVTTALLVYTNTNSAQENAIAYVLNVPKGFYNNPLGAAAFFGGLYGMNLIWLLLIIILILIIVLIARRYFWAPATFEEYHSDKK